MIQNIKGTLALNIPKQNVMEYLSNINIIPKNIKGNNNQIKRDNNEYHITIINPKEMKKLKHSTFPKIDTIIDDLLFIGLGKVKNDISFATYIVVRSKKLSKIRQNLGLKNYDFHITLGFTNGDVFNVDKNMKTIYKLGPIDTNIEKCILKEEPKILMDNLYLSGTFKYLKNTYIKSTIDDTLNIFTNTIDGVIFKNSKLNGTYSEKILNVLNYKVSKTCIQLTTKRLKYYHYNIKECKFYHEELPRNFSFIRDNLAGSGIPSKLSYHELLKKLGFTCVVTLRETCLPKDIQVSGIEYKHYYVDDRTPPTNEQMKDITKTISFHEQTLVHCEGGVGRTATAIAAYLMFSEKLSFNETMSILSTRKTILDDSQKEFLLKWYNECINDNINIIPKRKSLIKLPKVIMLVGLPASGKSTFSKIIGVFGLQAVIFFLTL
jgi:hypothetical protein